MFVERQADQIEIPNFSPAPRGFSTPGEVLSAGSEVEAIESNYWNLNGRRERERYDALWGTVKASLGEDPARQMLADALAESGDVSLRDFLRDHSSLGLAFKEYGPAFDFRANPLMRDAMLSLITAASSANPDLFRDIPTSHDAIMEDAKKQTLAEYRDALDTLAMGGEGRAIDEFLGRSITAVTGASSLALMPFGAGGSVARVIASETLLGALGEAATLPGRFKQAEYLDIQDPNAALDILFGAAVGGAVGGAIVGARPAIDATAKAGGKVKAAVQARLRPTEPKPPEVRAVEAAQIRQASPQNIPHGVPAAEVPERIALAEDALLGDPNAASQLAAMDRPAIDPQVERDRAAQAIEDEAAAFWEQSAKENPELKKKFPLANWIKRNGGIQTKRRVEGFDTPTLMGAELKSRGVDTRRLPWLFNNKTGGEDLDNTSLLDALVDEIGGGGLDNTSLLDALVDEIDGGKPFYTSPGARRAAEQYAEMIQAASRARLAEADIPAQRADEPRFENADAQAETYVMSPREADLAEFDPAVIIDRVAQVERAIAALPMADQIDPLTKRLVREKLAKEGGDAQDAFYDAIVRLEGMSNDEIRDAFGPDPSARERADGPQARDDELGATGPERRDEGQVADDLAADRTERTDAGDQIVIPGVEPVTQRQRLESRQGDTIDGGERGPDSQIGGLFDSDFRMTRDMFEDMTAPEATRAMDAKEREIRQAMEDDPELFAPADNEIVENAISPRDLLDQIEEDRRHLDAMQQCILKGTPG